MPETIKDIAVEYLAKKRNQEKFGNRRASTIKKIENIIENHIIPNFGKYKAEEFTEGIWEGFLLGGAPNKREVWVYLKSLLSFARNKGSIKKIPDLENPPPSKYTGRSLTWEESKRLLEVSEGFWEIGLFSQLCLLHGARPGEIKKLEWARVDLEGAVIHLRKEDVKTGKSRSFPILTSVFLKKPPIESLKSLSKKGGRYVFPGRGSESHRSSFWIHNEFLNLLKKAEIKGRFTPHGMRHTFHTLAAKKLKDKSPGFSLVEVLTMTGITHSVFLKSYLHLKPEDLHGLGEVFK